MLNKALNTQDSPDLYFNKLCKKDKSKICQCGTLTINEEQELNHKPCCKLNK